MLQNIKLNLHLQYCPIETFFSSILEKNNTSLILSCLRKAINK